jgi:hypothetical protein
VEGRCEVSDAEKIEQLKIERRSIAAFAESLAKTQQDLKQERDTWRLAAERWEASAERWKELYNDLRRIVEAHVKQATEVLP